MKFAKNWSHFLSTLGLYKNKVVDPIGLKLVHVQAPTVQIVLRVCFITFTNFA